MAKHGTSVLDHLIRQAMKQELTSEEVLEITLDKAHFNTVRTTGEI